MATQLNLADLLAAFGAMARPRPQRPRPIEEEQLFNIINRFMREDTDRPGERDLILRELMRGVFNPQETEFLIDQQRRKKHPAAPRGDKARV